MNVLCFCCIIIVNRYFLIMYVMCHPHASTVWSKTAYMRRSYPPAWRSLQDGPGWASPCFTPDTASFRQNASFTHCNCDAISDCRICQRLQLELLCVQQIWKRFKSRLRSVCRQLPSACHYRFTAKYYKVGPVAVSPALPFITAIPNIGHNLFSCLYRVGQKSKPLPNDQKIVLNRIKACPWVKV